jgi:hypothetical protein
MVRATYWFVSATIAWASPVIMRKPYALSPSCVTAASAETVEFRHKILQTDYTAMIIQLIFSALQALGHKETRFIHFEIL